MVLPVNKLDINKHLTNRELLLACIEEIWALFINVHGNSLNQMPISYSRTGPIQRNIDVSDCGETAS